MSEAREILWPGAAQAAAAGAQNSVKLTICVACRGCYKMALGRKGAPGPWEE